MKEAKIKKLKVISIIIVAILIVLYGSFYFYTLDYYRADDIAIHTVNENPKSIITSKSITTFYPTKSNKEEIGIIFYPGGKVEAVSYAPLLKKLSDNGFMCVLAEMPFNLAVFNINIADSIIDKFPEIDYWFIAGHSLGGAMSSSYVKGNSERLSGLILLGAYPINGEDIATLAIYGSEDNGLDISKLSNTGNTIRIQGGNHAYFGNYGEQHGDGAASITREEQQSLTVKEITKFIENHIYP